MSGLPGSPETLYLPGFWPGGFAFDAPESSAGSAKTWYRFDSEGRAAEVARNPHVDPRWSPDGEHELAKIDGAWAASVVDESAGTRTGEDPLQLPDADWQLAGWESPTKVVLWLTSGAGTRNVEYPVAAVVRCDVTTVVCERVANAPTEATFPG